MYFLLIWSASSVTVDHNGVSNVLEAWSIEVLDHMELSICVWSALGIWSVWNSWSTVLGALGRKWKSWIAWSSWSARSAWRTWSAWSGALGGNRTFGTINNRMESIFFQEKLVIVSLDILCFEIQSQRCESYFPYFLSSLCNFCPCAKIPVKSC